MSALPHPSLDELDLALVLAALGDETRLGIVCTLAANDDGAMTCSQFLHLGSKTGLSYHLGKLREAGLVNVRPEGTKRLISLRRGDLDRRFPGFLASILACAPNDSA